MASYGIFIEDIAGNFTVTVQRAPVTGPIGGTSLPFTWTENALATPTIARAITGATNATPIVLTVAAGHGVIAGDPVRVRAVGGNTAANGTFTAASVTSTSITLLGSAGNASYTAATGTFREIDKTKLISAAIQVASRAILNDRQANG